MKMLSQRRSFITAFASSIILLVAAQYPPHISYDFTIKSPIDSEITISYNEPRPGTCATVFAHQKQYTGYIRLPPFTLAPIQQNYPINTFFWFVEARAEPEIAPLTIWLNGGPGSSSMIGFFQENGPCEVVETSDGVFETRPRSWGWDRSSNVLYIDQPGQTGFSYDTATNKTVDLIKDDYRDPHGLENGHRAWTVLNGTFGSMDEETAINSTEIAARASWHFLQAFLSTFPQYNPGLKRGNVKVESAGVHLFAESYGGIYGPTFAEFFEEQNAKRLSGELPLNQSLEIKLESLGIINGRVDELIQAPFGPQFAYNNSYGLEIIGQQDFFDAHTQYSRPYGCSDQAKVCRNAADDADPNDDGDNLHVNILCSQATYACLYMNLFYLNTGRNPYDIRETKPVSSPPMAYLEYLNHPAVQSSIGAQINFTQSNYHTYAAFIATGDSSRGTQLASLAHLLNLGVRIAFIYGDADYICNWPGGEAISLALASLSPDYTRFSSAGYAPLVVNDSYIGGEVRQYGNLSFTRVYDAGHLVPYYQPETAFTLFDRIIHGAQLSNGLPLPPDYSTQGPLVSEHRNKVPVQKAPVCYLRDARNTCTREQILAIEASNGTLRNGVWTNASSSSSSPLSLFEPPSGDIIPLPMKGARIAHSTPSSRLRLHTTSPASPNLETDFTAPAQNPSTENHWKIVTLSMASIWSIAFLVAVCWLPRAMRSARVVDAMIGRVGSRAGGLGEGEMDEVGTLGGDYGRGRRSGERWGIMVD